MKGNLAKQNLWDQLNNISVEFSQQFLLVKGTYGVRSVLVVVISIEAKKFSDSHPQQLLSCTVMSSFRMSGFLNIFATTYISNKTYLLPFLWLHVHENYFLEAHSADVMWFIKTYHCLFIHQFIFCQRCVVRCIFKEINLTSIHHSSII